MWAVAHLPGFIVIVTLRCVGHLYWTLQVLAFAASEKPDAACILRSVTHP